MAFGIRLRNILMVLQLQWISVQWEILWDKVMITLRIRIKDLV
jgi:hypothetical protein